MAKFGDAERHIASLLSIGNKFTLHNRKYTITNSDKPTCDKGEPKTDIYVLANDENDKSLEIKISFKKENADFIENKTNDERAKAIFGSNWDSIIECATKTISEMFEGKHLIFKADYRRTNKGSITLGWKYELLNKTGGDLSAEINLSEEQLLDVYAGTHLTVDKRNAHINGQVINNSGIANYILMNDSLTSTQDVIDNIIPIKDYIKANPKLYFACKALNYRTFENKWDGDRPLSVFVDWTIKDGKLHPTLVYDKPLITKGNSVAKQLIDCLNTMNIKTTDDITEETVTKPSIIYSK